ncbi:hypothetical protein MAR_034516 [Mya arenaria]|uniref:Uncharacterized protein n=1 Tax=Mya arenaria TaxID=6604 RepID=A0ABY7GF54_MYAAR|nr:hypothetical protein MAR_034516 [Mya arenaria]
MLGETRVPGCGHAGRDEGTRMWSCWVRRGYPEVVMLGETRVPGGGHAGRDEGTRRWSCWARRGYPEVVMLGETRVPGGGHAGRDEGTRRWSCWARRGYPEVVMLGETRLPGGGHAGRDEGTRRWSCWARRGYPEGVMLGETRVPGEVLMKLFALYATEGGCSPFQFMTANKDLLEALNTITPDEVKRIYKDFEHRFDSLEGELLVKIVRGLFYPQIQEKESDLKLIQRCLEYYAVRGNISTKDERFRVEWGHLKAATLSVAELASGEEFQRQVDEKICRLGNDPCALSNYDILMMKHKRGIRQVPEDDTAWIDRIRSKHLIDEYEEYQDVFSRAEPNRTDWITDRFVTTWFVYAAESPCFPELQNFLKHYQFICIEVNDKDVLFSPFIEHFRDNMMIISHVFFFIGHSSSNEFVEKVFNVMDAHLEEIGYSKFTVLMPDEESDTTKAAREMIYRLPGVQVDCLQYQPWTRVVIYESKILSLREPVVRETRAERTDSKRLYSRESFAPDAQDGDETPQTVRTVEPVEKRQKLN